MTDIVKILNRRRALYERYADCVIATDALTPEACAEAVLGAVGLGANLGDDRGTVLRIRKNISPGQTSAADGKFLYRNA